VRYRQQFTVTVDEIKARLEVSANSKAKSVFPLPLAAQSI
jgi:hypothetical protein